MFTCLPLVLQGANDRRLHYAQGKALGGSSGRNQMLYNRGTVGSMGMWADEVNDDAYRWENILPFYEKSVTLTPPDMDVRAANASANYSASTLETDNKGPVHLSYPAYAQPLSSYGPAAFAAAGMPAVQDFISGKLDGYNYFASTIDPETGLRSSAETSFLSPAMSSDRLTVYQWSTAQRILFDDDKRATGVEVNLHGLPPYKLNARNEVILSAGAVSRMATKKKGFLLLTSEYHSFARRTSLCSQALAQRTHSKPTIFL